MIMNIADRNSLIPLTPQIAAILLALAERPLYGYAIAQQGKFDSGGIVSMSAGSIYPGLNRLMALGCVELAGTSKATSSPYKRKLYCLTSLGRDVLKMEADRQAEFVALVRHRLRRPT
jgi:DNA-binding PadR family transcriptional regulator